MYTKITSEETYTLSEAKRKAKRENILYYAKQKFIGVGLIIISVLIPIICDGDATASLLFLPLGLCLLFTKKKVVY